MIARVFEFGFESALVATALAAAVRRRVREWQSITESGRPLRHVKQQHEALVGGQAVCRRVGAQTDDFQAKAAQPANPIRPCKPVSPASLTGTTTRWGASNSPSDNARIDRVTSSIASETVTKVQRSFPLITLSDLSGGAGVSAL